jgi:hypothetical protein
MAMKVEEWFVTTVTIVTREAGEVCTTINGPVKRVKQVNMDQLIHNIPFLQISILNCHVGFQIQWTVLQIPCYHATLLEVGACMFNPPHPYRCQRHRII